MTPCTFGLALVLLTDTSGSVDTTEYGLQKQGLVHAFQDPAVHKAVWQRHGMMVTYVEWSDKLDIVVPWTLIDGAEPSLAFAAQMAVAPRASDGSTHVGEALQFGISLFQLLPCQPHALVIDVSGDGRSNGGKVQADRAKAEAEILNITINGLPILGENPEYELAEYYRTNVITEGGFLVVADTFEDFARAIRQKLVQEIADGR